MSVLTENVLVDIFIFLLFLLSLAIAYYKWSFSYWEKKNVEYLEPTIPFGNFKHFFLGKHSFGKAVQIIHNKYKTDVPYLGVYLFSVPIFIIRDLDLIRQIFTKDFQHFTDHGNYVNEKRDPLSGHLFNLTGAKWRTLRVKLTPTFTSGKMKMMFQTLVDCSKELEAIMDEETKKIEPFDIKDVLGRLTTDIIGSCAFGLDCNSLKNPDSEFRKFGKKIFETSASLVAKNFLAQSFPTLANWLGIRLMEKSVSDFFMNVVKDTVAYRENNKIVRKDVLQLLIELKNNGNVQEDDKDDHKTENITSLTIEEIAAECFVFFAAGFETSSTTLTYCFYELVANPDIQEKLRKEIVSVLEKHGGKITYDAIMDMQYMDKCINGIFPLHTYRVFHFECAKRKHSVKKVILSKKFI